MFSCSYSGLYFKKISTASSGCSWDHLYAFWHAWMNFLVVSGLFFMNSSSSTKINIRAGVIAGSLDNDEFHTTIKNNMVKGCKINVERTQFSDVDMSNYSGENILDSDTVDPNKMDIGGLIGYVGVPCIIVSNSVSDMDFGSYHVRILNEKYDFFTNDTDIIRNTVSYDIIGECLWNKYNNSYSYSDNQKRFGCIVGTAIPSNYKPITYNRGGILIIYNTGSLSDNFKNFS